MQLGQAVHEPVQQLGHGVGLPVPGGVQRRVVQPEVGRQVDDDPHPRHDLGHQLLGLAVGQGHEHQVQTVQLGRIGGGEGQ